MLKTLRMHLAACTVALAALMLAFPTWTVPVRAQSTLNQTTTAAAVSQSSATVAVASASTIAAGQILVIDAESMVVQSVSGTTLTVQRGFNRTSAKPHASGAVVFSGPASYFAQQDNQYAGACTASQFTVLPVVVSTTGSVYNCQDSAWVRYRSNGLQSFSQAITTTYTSAGAITVKPGTTLIGGSGALAMTLAAPAVYQNGMIMNIIASVAQAHTITNTAGFNGGTTARDVCTLGGAIGDGLVIQAWNGVWYTLSRTNCTLA